MPRNRKTKKAAKKQAYINTALLQHEACNKTNKSFDTIQTSNISDSCTVLSNVRIGNEHTHTHPFNGPLSGTTRVSRYQKGKTNMNIAGARDSEWQWHQLGHMQICTSLQTDNHASTPPLSFLQAGCPSCRPTNSVKALNRERKCAENYDK